MWAFPLILLQDIWPVAPPPSSRAGPPLQYPHLFSEIASPPSLPPGPPSGPWQSPMVCVAVLTAVTVLLPHPGPQV